MYVFILVYYLYLGGIGCLFFSFGVLRGRVVGCVFKGVFLDMKKA